MAYTPEMQGKKQKDGINFPWYASLKQALARSPKQVDYPNTIDALILAGQYNSVAQKHAEYLTNCRVDTRKVWRPKWQEIIAVGPFVGYKKKRQSIPFLLIAEYESAYPEIVTLSEALADAYINSNILAQIYLVPFSSLKVLERDGHWQEMRSVSLSWSKD